MISSFSEFHEAAEIELKNRFHGHNNVIWSMKVKMRMVSLVKKNLLQRWKDKTQ